MKKPPKTAVSSLSGVTSGKWTVARHAEEAQDRQGAAGRERLAELMISGTATNGRLEATINADNDPPVTLATSIETPVTPAVDEIARFEEPV